MGEKRSTWQGDFERTGGGPPASFEVRAGVMLSDEPPRADYLLVRKGGWAGEDAEGGNREPPVSLGVGLAPGPVIQRLLSRLGALLPSVSVVVCRSPAVPYCSGDLDRLWACLHAHFAEERARLADRDSTPPDSGSARGCLRRLSRRDLCAVLVVPRRSAALDEDIEGMGLGWQELGSGSYRVYGGLFTLFLVELDGAVKTRSEGLRRVHSHPDLAAPAA